MALQITLNDLAAEVLMALNDHPDLLSGVVPSTSLNDDEVTTFIITDQHAVEQTAILLTFTPPEDGMVTGLLLGSSKVLSERTVEALSTVKSMIHMQVPPPA